MELRLFLASLVRGWYILVAALLLGLIVAGAHYAITEPSYTSSARLQVNARSTADINDAVQASALAVQLAANYAELAGTDLVLTPAAERSGVDVSAADLATAVTTVATENSAFLTVTAKADTASSAQKIAEAVSQQLIAAARSGSSSTSALALREVQPANAPTLPTSGSPRSELPLGAVIGLVVGIVAVLLRDRFDARFRNLGGVSAATATDVLGALPNDRRAKRVAAISMPDRSPERYEAFRSLRTALTGQGLLPDSGAVLAVTSSVPDEGKTSVVAGLAIAIAASGRNVVVVEGDLRRARLARAFGIQPGTGLTDVLVGKEPVGSALQLVPHADRVKVLRAGPSVLSSSELFESEAFETLLAELRQEATVVLVDSPPLLAVADAAAIARRADHVLLVVGAPVVKEREVQRALSVLHQVQVTVAGIVVNRMPKIWADSTVGSYRSYAGSEARGAR